MLKSLLIYSKFFFKSVLSPEERTLLKREWERTYYEKPTFKESREYKVDNNQLAKSLYMAVEWLLRAQFNMPDYGFGSFRIGKGWTTSYPETTGYIIPTLMAYAKIKNEHEIRNCCVRAANWLVEIQKSSGGWQGETLKDNRPEVVFNTGQIIRGLIAVYQYDKDEKFLNSAIKAANWLCDIQESNGSWVKNAFMNVARVYDSYVDVPLLQLYKITGNERYKETAIKNLDWIIHDKQQANGWFQDCDNTIKHNDKPILHTIAYTIDGLINAGLLLNRNDYVEAGQKAANKLLDQYNKNRIMHGRYDKDWNGSGYPILTGYAQMAINWMNLYHITQNKAYLNASLEVNRQLVWLQRADDCSLESVRGAISGSFPLWGKYEPFSYPNWATKYFVDALLLEVEELKVEI
jgi:hypothetical protein